MFRIREKCGPIFAKNCKKKMYTNLYTYILGVVKIKPMFFH